MNHQLPSARPAFARKRAILLTACSLLLLCPLISRAQQSGTSGSTVMLDSLVGGETLWDTTIEKFETEFARARLQWLTKTKDQARFFGNYGVWNGELKVTEAVIEFQNGKLFRTNLSLFNRGDSRTDIPTKAALDQLLESVKKSVTAHAGVQPVDLGKQGSSAVKALGYAWVTKPSIYLLEYSFQKDTKPGGQQFQPEFVRLRVYAAPKQLGFGTRSPTGTTNAPQVNKGSLTANLTKDAGGDVYIKNMPMVDQGPKGYCVVATAERVFRYYGMPVDQHEMAQVANTGAGGGTNPETMMKSLTALQGRLHVHVRSITKWDFTEFNKLLADYNREAKRNKQREVSIAGQHVIDIGAIFGSMDPASLKDAKTVKTKAGYDKFQRSVAEHIDKGVPLMWSVHLGLYPEPEIPQARGGHMRLIIGYNAKTKEIIYSDSWGATHAMKRMPMDNAWAMTTGLYFMEPSL